MSAPTSPVTPYHLAPRALLAAAGARFGASRERYGENLWHPAFASPNG